VRDPSAYGLVRCRDDRSVEEFLEKPGPDAVVDTNLVNAGAYILERDVLDGMAPAGSVISIERDVFPTLVDHGLFGYRAKGYWLDIGTPGRYLQATFDIMESSVTTAIGTRLTEAPGARLTDGATISGRVVGPAVVGEGCEIEDGAVVGGSVVLGRGVKVCSGARIAHSVLMDGVTVGERTEISEAIISAGAEIGPDCRIVDRVMLGDGVRVGSGNMLCSGIKIFPEVELPEEAIKF